MAPDCGMKGYLRFLILLLLNKEPLSGVKLACEIEKRKGSKPSPGTIYPALKELRKKGLIEEAENSVKDKLYILTEHGKTELGKNCEVFCRTFYDLVEQIESIKVT